MSVVEEGEAEIEVNDMSIERVKNKLFAGNKISNHCPHFKNMEFVRFC